MLPWFVEAEAERHLLALREILVRCDENLKAAMLMQQCVPYFLEEDHPQVEQARKDQLAMVAHIIGGPEAYRDYYSTNEHERPFEEQYGVEASKAHEGIPRLALLRQALEENVDRISASAREPAPVLLDCSCNDGWMAANLRKMVTYHGIDLNPDSIERAIERDVPSSRFLVGDIHDAERLTRSLRPDGGYDIVVCFECLEHVPDPRTTMDVLAGLVRPGGQIFVSTPAGAVERGDLPRWWHVEPKGHVRVFTPRTFHELLSPYGDLGAGIAIGPDQVMVARVTANAPSEDESLQGLDERTSEENAVAAEG